MEEPGDYWPGSSICSLDTAKTSLGASNKSRKCADVIIASYNCNPISSYISITNKYNKWAGSAVPLRSQFQQFTISNKHFNIGGHLQVPRSEVPSSFRRWMRLEQSLQQTNTRQSMSGITHPPTAMATMPNGWFAQAGGQAATCS
jgi:hypothetical protein